MSDFKESFLKNNDIINNELKKIIDNNQYIISLKNTNKCRDIYSLSYLINKKISHSDCIRLGISIENILLDIILHYTSLTICQFNKKKSKKEKGHLFIDEKNKIIYYIDIKSSLMLDSEKTIAIINKYHQIEHNLKLNYEKYDIKMFLLCLRYFDKSNIPLIIKRKYFQIENSLLGVNDYLDILQSKYLFNNEMDYINFLNYISDFF